MFNLVFSRYLYGFAKNIKAENYFKEKWFKKISFITFRVAGIFFGG
jgi:hypothetical protein